MLNKTGTYNLLTGVFADLLYKSSTHRSKATFVFRSQAKQENRADWERGQRETEQRSWEMLKLEGEELEMTCRVQGLGGGEKPCGDREMSL